MRLHRGGAALWAGLAITAAAACGGANPARNPSLAGPVSTNPSSSATTRPASGNRCPTNAAFAGPVNDHGARPISGSRATVEAGDFFFAPTCQTQAPSSGTLTLVVHNGGQALHNVSVPDQNIDTDVQAGDTITVTVRLAASPFTFFCKYHRTSGMVGAIVPTGT